MQVSSKTLIQQNAASDTSNDLLKILGGQMNGDASVSALEAKGEFSGLLEGELSSEELELLEKNPEEVLAEGEAKDKSKAIPTANHEGVQRAPAVVTKNSEDLNSVLNLTGDKRAVVDNLKPADYTPEVSSKNPQKLDGILKPDSLQNLEKAESKQMNQVDLNTVMKKGSDEQIAKAALVQKKEVSKADGLMDLNQFMARQSDSVQKRAGTEAYKSQVQKSIFADKFAKNETIKMPTTNSQADILSNSLNQEMEMMDRQMELGSKMSQNSSSSDLGLSLAPKAAATLNMNTLNLDGDTDQVIDQIKNYIVQSKVSSSPSVDLSFKHSELGTIDLHLNKADREHINIMISTSTSEGAKFFNQNKTDLLSTLSMSGVKVSDFKLDNQNSFDSSSSKNFSGGQQGQQNHADAQQRRDDSQRRRDLWELMQQRSAA